MKRIGVNTLFLVPSDVGGAETYFCETMRAMLESKPDAAFVLFTHLGNDDFLRERFSRFERIDFVRLNFNASNRFVRILREQAELPLKIRTAAPDVVWSPGYTMPIFSGPPQVVSILDVQYKSHPEDFTPLARLTTDILVRGACCRAKTIIAISEFSKSEIVRCFGVDADRIRVTHLAADESFRVPREPAEIRKTVRAILKEDRPYILCVAHSYPHKNLPALVRAFGEIGGKIPHRLLIVGKARLGDADLTRAIAKLPEPHRVHRVDHVAREELIALYQGADLLAHPSLYEGFGLPILEAMAAGVPVVAARCASIPEIGGDAILYFDDRNPSSLPRTILEALQMPADVRTHLIECARSRAASFSWQKTAALTLDCLLFK